LCPYFPFGGRQLDKKRKALKKGETLPEDLSEEQVCGPVGMSKEDAAVHGHPHLPSTPFSPRSVQRKESLRRHTIKLFADKAIELKHRANLEQAQEYVFSLVADASALDCDVGVIRASHASRCFSGRGSSKRRRWKRRPRR
jgi:hypothetical protein